MKNVLKIVALLTAVIMIFSLTACGRRQTSSGYWVGSDYVDSADLGDVSESDGVSSASTGNSTTTSTGNSITTSNSNENTTSTTSGGNGNSTNRKDNTWQIDRNVKMGGGSKSITSGLDFGGKTIRFLDWVDIHNAQTDSMISEFEKKYNCKVDVDSINFEDYLSVLAAKQAAGLPYDIITMSSTHMLQSAISNLIQPLENHISSADTTTSVSKPGINWEISKKSAWGGHVYMAMGNRPTWLVFMFYNKLLYNDYGLEDPLTLYKQGKWTFEKIQAQAKIVKNSNSGVHLYDSTVSGEYQTALYPGSFYEIDDSGLITFTGASTKYANAYTKSQAMYEICPLTGYIAQTTNFVSGKCMLWVVESVKLPGYIAEFKGSAALGKNLKNIGVVPIPTCAETNNVYRPASASVGFCSGTGANAKAALAYLMLTTTKSEPWESCGIPAVEKNKELLVGLYDKTDVKNGYTFHSSDGRRIGEVTYDMTVKIANGGDIIKLLDSWAPTVKSIIDYNLAQQ